MQPERLHALERIFNEALLLPREQRVEFVARHCRDVPEMQAEVLELLRYADEPTRGGKWWSTDLLRARESLYRESPFSLDPPPEIPGYVLHDLLGRGGTGCVYAATCVATGAEVAVKILSVKLAASQHGRAWHRSECEALRDLAHPGVVRRLDDGEAGGRPFLVLELVRGENLARRLAGRPQDAEQTRVWLRKLATIVDYFHSRSWVHGDLKPGNIIAAATSEVKNRKTEIDDVGEDRDDGVDTPAGAARLEPAATGECRRLSAVGCLSQATPVVCDFGLVRRLGARGEPVPTLIPFGTPHYAAPEQLRESGPEASRASDLYSLGAIAFEMLTGRPPFEGAPRDVIPRVLAEPVPSPSDFATGVPEELSAVVRRCLLKDPAARFSGVAELIVALEQCAGSSGPRDAA